MNTTFFENAAQEIQKARVALVDKYTVEETEDFLSQAFTLAVLQMIDSFVEKFSDEDMKEFNSYFENMTSDVLPEYDLSPLLIKYNLTETDLCTIFTDKFTAIVEPEL